MDQVVSSRSGLRVWFASAFRIIGFRSGTTHRHYGGLERVNRSPDSGRPATYPLQVWGECNVADEAADVGRERTETGENLVFALGEDGIPKLACARPYRAGC